MWGPMTARIQWSPVSQVDCRADEFANVLRNETNRLNINGNKEFRKCFGMDWIRYQLLSSHLFMCVTVTYLHNILYDNWHKCLKLGIQRHNLLIIKPLTSIVLKFSYWFELYFITFIFLVVFYYIKNRNPLIFVGILVDKL